MIYGIFFVSAGSTDRMHTSASIAPGVGYE